MKRVIITSIAAVLAAVSALAVNKEDLKGQWTVSDSTVTTVLTITDDSICFEEVGNEAFTYKYVVKGDDVIYSDMFGDNVMHVVLLDKDFIGYMMGDEKVVYILNKKQ